MASIRKPGSIAWKAFSKRLWQQIVKDDIFGRAAQLSYYFLLALFPLLIFLITIFGFFANSGSELRQNLLDYLGQVMPAAAADLVQKTMTEISKQAGGGKLSFGVLATLWAASNGMGAISKTLNIAYEVEETRPWWKVRLITVGLTIAIAVLIFSALALTLYGHRIAAVIAASYGLSDSFTGAWKILQWPIVLLFVLLSFNLIYIFAPDIKERSWRWVTPGAATGIVLWLVVSFSFKLYLSYFNSYSATYGSLGALIVMMLWFYLTGLAILIGGEINSALENVSAAETSDEGQVTS